MIPANFPYFENKSIDRKLTQEGVAAVLEYLVEQGELWMLRFNVVIVSNCSLSQCFWYILWIAGNGEWEDTTHTRMRILWKTPEALAGEIFTWASNNGFLENVFTVFELLSGDEYQGSGEEYLVCVLPIPSTYLLPFSFLQNLFSVLPHFLPSGFHGTDSSLFRRALQVLEKSSKCIIMAGTTYEEDGIKFLQG
jgi:hypothetical protein